MSLDAWLLYMSLTLVLIASPGPSALLCVSHGIRHGARQTVATILGGITASMTLMLLSALGLGAVIAASDTLFHAIKWAGAAYLIYLGISTWRSHPQAAAAQGEEVAEMEASDGVAATTPASQLYRKGLMVGIGNPKDLLFFSALFPQFMNPAEPIAGQLAILALSWVALDSTIMFAYALFGAKLLVRMSRGGMGRWFNRVTGGAFIAAGGALAASSR